MFKMKRLQSSIVPTACAILAAVLIHPPSAFLQTPPAQDQRGIKLKSQKEKAEEEAKKRQTTTEKPELVLQTGHSLKAEGLAFSPDGRYLATGSVDKTIKIWDAATGRELRTLAGHTGEVKTVAFSPDGRQLASGGNDGRIILWDIASGGELTELSAHAKAVAAIAFSRDGRWLASGGADFAVKLWDVAAKRESQNFSGHYGWVLSVAFNPDGSALVSGSADSTVRVWDLSSKSKPDHQVLQGHTGWVRSVAFSPDGRTIASTGDDSTVRLWRSPKWKSSKSPVALSGRGRAVSFAASGAQLLAATDDRTIKRFDAESQDQIESIPDGGEPGRYETAVFSADGARLAANSGSREVELRGVSAAGERHRLESRANAIQAIAFSADGNWLAAGNQDTTLTLWDAVAGRAVANLAGNAGSITTVAFSPDSRLLVSGSKGGVIAVWDTIDNREVRKWMAHADGVNSLVFSPDGRRLISSGVETPIRIWDVENGKEIERMTGHTKEVRSAAASADGKLLATGGADELVKLWETGSGKEIRTMRGHAGAVFAVAMSADGRWIASGGLDRTVRIWDATTGSEVRGLPGLNARIDAVAFSPDGRWIAAGAADGRIKLWEAATGQLRFDLDGHSSGVNSLAFGPEGRWLVSGSEDGSARIWESETGENAATLVSLRYSAEWLVVTPDGLFDGSATAWNQILWRFARNTYSAAPVELFFNEFYYPELLADVLAGKGPRAATDITLRDRRQPGVKMTIAEAQNRAPVASRSITVKLEVAEAAPAGDQKQGSGAHDVRLFRNGSLVKAWRGDVIGGKGGSITLECTMPIVAGENRLTAYAFNRDNVKSADETLTVTGAQSLARRGTLYVVAAGVNQYANQDYNLKFAVADAELFSAELSRQQSQLGRFAQIEIVKLLDRQATKTNLLAALKRLAGDSSPIPAGAPPELQKLKAAQPEDAVVVYFAGHGTAQESRFYLITQDIGYRGKRDELDEAGLRQVLASSISDLELEKHFENVDAGQLLFVIDACNSGQALEADEKRRGPMNSKGLAQLAYEKGMNILTAAQSYQFAMETSQLGHGYLTYALVEDGLKNLGADNHPRDGQIVLREWLDHATEQVPRMQEARLKQTRGLNLQRIKEEKKTVQDLQRPRAFYRREAGQQQMIIAKP
jgi:WD40 repeat protein/uncharacterized caspase-like protein